MIVERSIHNFVLACCNKAYNKARNEKRKEAALAATKIAAEK